MENISRMNLSFGSLILIALHTFVIIGLSKVAAYATSVEQAYTAAAVLSLSLLLYWQRAKHAEYKAEQAKKAEIRLVSLQKETATREGELNELITSLRSALEAAERKVGALQMANDGHRSEISSLRLENQALTSANKKLLSENASLDGRIAVAEAKLKAAHGTLSAVEAQNAELLDRNSALVGQINDYARTAETYEQTAKQATAEAAEWKGKVVSLQNTINALKRKSNEN